MTGNTSMLANKATADTSPNTNRMMGIVAIWAALVSTRIDFITPGFLRKNLLLNAGASTSTPKKAASERYQPTLNHTYAGVMSALIVDEYKSRVHGFIFRPKYQAPTLSV